MSRNEPRSTTRPLTPGLRQSRGCWLLIALVVGLGTWSSRLAGQNAASLPDQSPNVVTDATGTKIASPARKFTTQDLNRLRTTRPNSKSAPTNGSVRTQQPATSATGSVKRDSAVKPASYEDSSGTARVDLGLSRDGATGTLVPSPLPPITMQARPASPGPILKFPTERMVPPQITGSHLGLQPGETATERSLRLMTVITDLEQHNARLIDEVARLNAELKARDAKLQSSTSQLSAARKELSLATAVFQQLRKEIADLYEKYRSAEEENASLMRSLSPLLKQLLPVDDELPTKD